MSLGWGWGQVGQRGLGRDTLEQERRGGSGILYAPWGEVRLGRGRVWEHLGHKEARGLPCEEAAANA